MLKELAYYDGVYGTPEEVKVPFNDRVHFSATASTTPPSAPTARFTCCRTIWTAFIPAQRRWTSASPWKKPSLAAC